MLLSFTQKRTGKVPMTNTKDYCTLCGREWGHHGKHEYKGAQVCDTCDKHIQELVFLRNNGNGEAEFLLSIADLKAQGISSSAFRQPREPECIRWAKERWR